MLVLGLNSIVCVPVFKIITHLPPYVGMMLALGVVSIFAEMYSNREFELSKATGPDPDGGTFSLEDRLGKITIIDFWASWCRPCRVENPNLVRLFNKHKDKGLQIVGVSLDRTKPKWIQAIADDGLVWDHVSNLQFWNDPIAKLYKVSAIPATFILDENGVILTRDLRGPMLERKIDELLGNM